LPSAALAVQDVATPATHGVAALAGQNVVVLAAQSVARHAACGLAVPDAESLAMSDVEGLAAHDTKGLAAHDAIVMVRTLLLLTQNLCLTPSTQQAEQASFTREKIPRRASQFFLKIDKIQSS
jgi:hypothetical protein